MKEKTIAALLLLFSWVTTIHARIFEVSRWKIIPNTECDQSANMNRMLADLHEMISNGTIKKKESIILRFESGQYHFHPDSAAKKEYYISNHDQTNPKNVAIALENFQNLTLEGNGAQFICHGRMIPLSLIGSKNCTLKDFSIDFANPHIAQAEIIENATDGTVFRIAPWVNYRIADGYFETYGEGWTLRQQGGIAFDGKTRHILYNTADLGFPTEGVYEVGPRTLKAPNWKDSRLKPGTVVAMRSWGRPTPGIFLYHNTNTTLKQVKVHYAEGMGLLAQLCDNITLDGFAVCLKGPNDPRYFTTQADATHFSGCKGKITSVNGLYEGMMDDAINVHGTYLKVVKRIDDHTLIGRYMHGQAWGFDWGFEGDKVQFVRSATMELIGKENKIASIRPCYQPTSHGETDFIIRFKDAVDPAISEQEGFGIENLTWTPEVYFAYNTIRNNRARGTLFSTPKRTVVEYNNFDHTSGAAILLCGDCNGWFETGACRDVIIRHNHFNNALTSMYQFTDAVISIYPEIPNLKDQQKYFHGGKKRAIRIEDNVFDTFDNPILYAKSVDGITFKRNIIRKNDEFAPFHWNKSPILFERVINSEVEGLEVTNK